MESNKQTTTRTPNPAATIMESPYLSAFFKQFPYHPYTTS